MKRILSTLLRQPVILPKTSKGMQAFHIVVGDPQFKPLLLIKKIKLSKKIEQL